MKKDTTLFPRMYIYVLFVIYIGIFFYAVFMQSSRKNITPENIDALVNFIPLKNTINDISMLIKKGLKGNMNLVFNTFGNIILFIPLPYFLINIFNCTKLQYVLMSALMLSIWVEVMQYVFMLGVSDIDDVFLNGLGTFAGWGLFAKR